jgi:hypothetical protein
MDLVYADTAEGHQALCEKYVPGSFAVQIDSQTWPQWNPMV